MPHGRLAGLGPTPVDAAVDGVGERADLALLGRFEGEVGRSGQHAGDEKSGVDRRQLAAPRAGAGVHVQKMVEEALVARGVRVAILAGVPEEPQGRECAGRGVRPADPAALDPHWIGRQGKSDHRDAGRCTWPRGVGAEAVRRIECLEEVAESGALKPIQQDLVWLYSR